MFVVFAFEDLGDDEGQIVAGDGLLGIPEGYDTLEHLALVVLREADAEVFQVFEQGGLAREFAQGVPAAARETLRAQPGMVEAGLVVAVGMDARGLGEDVLAHDGGVVGQALARKVGDQLADPDQVGLVDPQVQPEVVAQVDRHLRQGGVPGALPQAIDGAVDRRRTRLGRRDDIGRGQPVVVVGVEVEPEVGKAPDHVRHGGEDLLRGHHAQGVRQHEVIDARVHEAIHQPVDESRIVAVAVRPVFQVEVDP